MRRIDITKSSKEDIYKFYDELIDNKVNNIIKKNGFPDNQDILDYQHTYFDEGVGLSDVSFPVADFKLEDLPETMTLAEAFAIKNKNLDDMNKEDYLNDLLACTSSDILTKLERLWVSKELPTISEEKVELLVDKKESQLVEMVEFLKEFLY